MNKTHFFICQQHFVSGVEVILKDFGLFLVILILLASWEKLAKGVDFIVLSLNKSNWQKDESFSSQEFTVGWASATFKTVGEKKFNQFLFINIYQR